LGRQEALSMAETPRIKATSTFGGMDLDLRCGDKSLAVINLNDEDVLEVVKRGLERLAGQGKLDKELRGMCHCVGEPLNA
jgi:acetylornithine/succinyldiaminopimelate/putrescine aminotransferase